MFVVCFAAVIVFLDILFQYGLGLWVVVCLLCFTEYSLVTGLVDALSGMSLL